MVKLIAIIIFTFLGIAIYELIAPAISQSGLLVLNATNASKPLFIRVSSIVRFPIPNSFSVFSSNNFTLASINGFAGPYPTGNRSYPYNYSLTDMPGPRLLKVVLPGWVTIMVSPCKNFLTNPNCSSARIRTYHLYVIP